VIYPDPHGPTGNWSLLLEDRRPPPSLSSDRLFLPSLVIDTSSTFFQGRFSDTPRSYAHDWPLEPLFVALRPCSFSNWDREFSSEDANVDVAIRLPLYDDGYDGVWADYRCMSPPPSPPPSCEVRQQVSLPLALVNPGHPPTNLVPPPSSLWRRFDSRAHISPF